MNTVIVKTVPSGVFEEISIERPDWKATFLDFVHRGKGIHYDVHTTPTIVNDIRDIRAELNKGNYCDFILERDQDQHFLIKLI